MGKIITSSILAILLILNTTTSAFALSDNEVDTAGAEGKTQVTFEVIDGSGGNEGGGGDSVLIATVPLEIPIIMDTDGDITLPSDVDITNHVEDKGVKVSNINIELKNSWIAKGYEEDYSTFEDNSKFIGMKLRGDKLLSDGTFPITDGNWNIAKKSSLPLNVGVKIPKQTVIHKDNIATLSFRIDWSGDNGDTGSNPDEGIDKNNKYTVSFITDDNTVINGEKQIEVDKGQQVSLPDAQPINIAYEFDKWVDTETNTEISNSTIEVEKDTILKAVSNQRAANPSDWFTVDSSGNLTGFTNTYNNMTDAPTDIVVPRQVGGTLVTGIGASAFNGKSALTSVVLHDEIKNIADSAFRNCASLKNILLPDKLSSIGLYAFMGAGLQKIEIPASIQTIPASTFADNTKLSNVTLHEGLKTIGNRAFANCTQLNKLDIPVTIQDIGMMAFTNTSITLLDLSQKEIYRIPNSPWGLTDDKIVWGTAPDWDTDPIRSDMVSVRNISWDSTNKAISVKTMRDSWGKIKNDSSVAGVINIPTTIDGIRVTEITGVKYYENNTSYPIGGFYGCDKLTQINVPNTVEKIGTNAFGETSSTAGNGPCKLNITIDNTKGIISGAPWGYKEGGTSLGSPWSQPINYLR